MDEIRYYYGMRLRGFAPGAQQKAGLIGRVEDNHTAFSADRFREYHDVIMYNRELTPDELDGYDLDYLGAELTHD